MTTSLLTVRRLRFRLVGVGGLRKRGQVIELLRPKRLEVGGERPQRRPVRPVVAAGALLADRDERGLAQHLQVLRYRPEGDVELASEIAGGALGTPAHPQNLPAAWLGDDLDSVHASPELTSPLNKSWARRWRALTMACSPTRRTVL